MGKRGMNRNGLARCLAEKALYQEWQIAVATATEPFFLNHP